MGGGDEMVVGQRLLSLSERTPLLRAGVLAMVGSLLTVGWYSARGRTVVAS
jgi:hypothetical protein